MAQFVPRTRTGLIRHHNSSWQPRICIHQARRREFSLYQRNQAASAAVRRVQPDNVKRPTQVHFKNQMKKMLQNAKSEDLPNDMGLFPETFIMPTKSNKPSIFKETRLRLRLEIMRLRQRFQDCGSMILYRWKTTFYRSVPAADRPKKGPTLDLLSITPCAKSLHKEVYTAFAAGDLEKLNDLCAESLFSSYAARLQRRTKSKERLDWELIRYLDRPRLASVKAGAMGMEIAGLPVGMQQAVVRIRSVQRLTKGTVLKQKGKHSEEEVIWTVPKEKSVTEYIVVQRRLVKAEYEDWKVWGFAKEFDVAEMREGNLTGIGIR